MNFLQRNSKDHEKCFETNDCYTFNLFLPHRNLYNSIQLFYSYNILICFRDNYSIVTVVQVLITYFFIPKINEISHGNHQLVRRPYQTKLGIILIPRISMKYFAMAPLCLIHIVIVITLCLCCLFQYEALHISIGGKRQHSGTILYTSKHSARYGQFLDTFVRKRDSKSEAFQNILTKEELKKSQLEAKTGKVRISLNLNICNIILCLFYFDYWDIWEYLCVKLSLLHEVQFSMT